MVEEFATDEQLSQEDRASFLAQKVRMDAMSSADFMIGRFLSDAPPWRLLPEARLERLELLERVKAELGQPASLCRGSGKWLRPVFWSPPSGASRTPAHTSAQKPACTFASFLHLQTAGGPARCSPESAAFRG